MTELLITRQREHLVTADGLKRRVWRYRLSDGQHFVSAWLDTLDAARRLARRTAHQGQRICLAWSYDPSSQEIKV